jgi:hypothetical protein
MNSAAAGNSIKIRMDMVCTYRYEQFITTYCLNYRKNIDRVLIEHTEVSKITD